MFPKLQKANTLLQKIVGRDEFFVKDQPGGFSVINYTHQTTDTFGMRLDRKCLYMDIEGNDVHLSAFLRECRGIFFNTQTKVIISRPFHKFFNVGENAATKIDAIDWEGHKRFDKADGSMIRPFILPNGTMRLASKMGITGVAMQAEVVLAKMGNEVFNNLKRIVHQNKTPLFELVGRDNRHVLSYGNNALVWLGTRDNYTGEYSHDPEDCPMGFTPIEVFEPLSNDPNAEIEEIKTHFDDCEGFVIALKSGDMVKIKTDWYVRLHRLRGYIRNEMSILDAYLNNDLDDIWPILSENETERVSDVVSMFEEKFDELSAKLAGLNAGLEYYINSGKDRKDVAINFCDKLHKYEKRFVFLVLDNPNLKPYEYITNTAKIALRNSAKYEDFKSWLIKS